MASESIDPAVGDEGVFEVDRVIDIMWENDDNGPPLYRVRWKGFPPIEDTWEPIENFTPETRKTVRKFVRYYTRLQIKDSNIRKELQKNGSGLDKHVNILSREIETITSMRCDASRDPPLWFYLVVWRDERVEDATWESEVYLRHASDLIDCYRSKRGVDFDSCKNIRASQDLLLDGPGKRKHKEKLTFIDNLVNDNINFETTKCNKAKDTSNNLLNAASVRKCTSSHSPSAELLLEGSPVGNTETSLFENSHKSSHKSKTTLNVSRRDSEGSKERKFSRAKSKTLSKNCIFNTGQNVNKTTDCKKISESFAKYANRSTKSGAKMSKLKDFEESSTLNTKLPYSDKFGNTNKKSRNMVPTCLSHKFAFMSKSDAKPDFKEDGEKLCKLDAKTTYPVSSRLKFIDKSYKRRLLERFGNIFGYDTDSEDVTLSSLSCSSSSSRGSPKMVDFCDDRATCSDNSLIKQSGKHLQHIITNADLQNANIGEFIRSLPEYEPPSKKCDLRYRNDAAFAEHFMQAVNEGDSEQLQLLMHNSHSAAFPALSSISLLNILEDSINRKLSGVSQILAPSAWVAVPPSPSTLTSWHRILVTVVQQGDLALLMVLSALSRELMEEGRNSGMGSILHQFVREAAVTHKQLHVTAALETNVLCF